MNLRSKSAKLALLPLVPLAALGTLGTVALVGAAPAGAASTTKVKAIETDFHIALSKKSFKAGTYTFVAINKGKTTHALAITGPGLHNASTPDFGPGQQAKLTVTFKSGAKYDIFCPVPGHKMLGMNMNVKVSGTAVTTSSKGSNTPGTNAASGGGAVSY
jgi:plastocyanin